ncbi:MAG: response regulator [Flavobacteriales bacterium]
MFTNKIKSREFCILIADDDDDDQMMLASAFREVGFDGPVVSVHDGEELMAYLQRTGKYEGTKSEAPHLILLDLNMPKKDGRTVLQEIRKNPKLNKIPIIVLITSANSDDISSSYELGANSFISKPSSFTELKEMARAIKCYWLDAALIHKTHSQI